LAAKLWLSVAGKHPLKGSHREQDRPPYSATS
jgi:hypothetical protein